MEKNGKKNSERVEGKKGVEKEGRKRNSRMEEEENMKSNLRIRVSCHCSLLPRRCFSHSLNPQFYSLSQSTILLTLSIHNSIFPLLTHSLFHFHSFSCITERGGKKQIEFNAKGNRLFPSSFMFVFAPSDCIQHKKTNREKERNRTRKRRRKCVLDNCGYQRMV